MSRIRDVMMSPLVLVLAAAAAGCVEIGNDADAFGAEQEISKKSSEIVGGSVLADPTGTRRSMGLVEVRSAGAVCSGLLTHPDYVLTATHCLDTSTGFANQFRIPRDPAAPANGTDYDERFGDSIAVLEGSDMSLVHLWEAPAGSTWPSVTRLASSTLPANIVGQNIITYGRGMTTYATPPTGTTSGAGTWKSLSRTVASTRAFLGGTELIINAAANGNSIVGWGDSGSGSLLNNNIVSVTTSLISYECYDSSTSDRCKQTTTKISSAGLRSVSDFATYINEAPNRPLTWASPLTNIQSPWIQDRRLEYSSPDSNVVTLRGQLRREVQGTSKLFLLPSGLRPARRMYVPVPALSGEILSARLRIEADGWVYLQTADATPNQVSVHLDGVQFSVKTDGFEALDLANGWVPFGNTMFTPAARKVGNTVYLQGSLKHPSTPSSMIVFTLDAGLRPPADTYVPIVLCSSERGRLVIQPNGNVRIETENSDADPACLTSLDGVSFRISTAGTSAAAMQNGWTGGVFSTLPLSFVFDGPWVRFLGAVGNGTDSHIITLPAKYRPRSTQVLTADGCGAQKAWVTITTDGKVRAYSATNGLPSCFVSFSGVSFVP